MKHIGKIREQLGWIHTYRNLAVNAVDDRDYVWLQESLGKMKEHIATLEKLMESGKS